jgi:hypothetical protein
MNRRDCKCRFRVLTAKNENKMDVLLVDPGTLPGSTEVAPQPRLPRQKKLRTSQLRGLLSRPLNVGRIVVRYRDIATFLACCLSCWRLLSLELGMS